MDRLAARSQREPIALSDNVATNPAILLTSNKYNISWKAGPQINNTEPYISRVVWIFPNGSSDTAGPTWETNTASSRVTLRFDDILKPFPTDLAPDMDSTTARGLVSGPRQNHIAVSIPNPSIDPAGDVPEDLSQPFTLQSALLASYLDTRAASAQQDEHGRWRSGVGVGVPPLMSVTRWTSWTMGKKSMKGNEHQGFEVIPK